MLATTATLNPIEARADYATWLADLEIDLGLTRVDNHDGTYHYELLSGLSTADRVGALYTWRYDGQANYAWSPPSVSMPLSADDEQDTGDDPSEGLDDLEGTTTVDVYGRKWRVVDVDVVSVNYAIADYWAEVAATCGLEQAPSGPEPTQDLDALSSVLDPNAATSWEFEDCSADGKLDTAIWDGESRSWHTSPPPSGYHRQALVHVRGPNGHCSGVNIADNLVLTAAHCVNERGSNEPRTVWLCPNAVSPISSCQVSHEPISSKRFKGLDKTGTSNIRSDFAVVKFEGSLSNPPMRLSTDNRSKIKKRTPGRVGFDRHFIHTGTCGSWSTVTMREHPEVPVNGTRSGLLRLKADVSVGASGGPYFFMDGRWPRVIGIHSALRSLWHGGGWVGGPRVTEFRKWAIAHGAN